MKGMGSNEGQLKGTRQISRGIWPSWETAVKAEDVHGRERGPRGHQATPETSVHSPGACLSSAWVPDLSNPPKHPSRHLCIRLGSSSKSKGLCQLETEISILGSAQC